MTNKFFPSRLMRTILLADAHTLAGRGYYSHLLGEARTAGPLGEGETLAESVNPKRIFPYQFQGRTFPIVDPAYEKRINQGQKYRTH